MGDAAGHLVCVAAGHRDRRMGVFTAVASDPRNGSHRERDGECGCGAHHEPRAMRISVCNSFGESCPLGIKGRPGASTSRSLGEAPLMNTMRRSNPGSHPSSFPVL